MPKFKSINSLLFKWLFMAITWLMLDSPGPRIPLMEHFHILALCLELRIKGRGSILPNLKETTLEKEIHRKQ